MKMWCILKQGNHCQKNQLITYDTAEKLYPLVSKGNDTHRTQLSIRIGICSKLWSEPCDRYKVNIGKPLELSLHNLSVSREPS